MNSAASRKSRHVESAFRVIPCLMEFDRNPAKASSYMKQVQQGLPQSGTQDIGLPPLIEAMMRPEFYPHRPASVELRQTHISYVFLAGDYVYKLKKPVRFPFIDCSSLQKRFTLCADEVRLNSRLSPSVYLGVFPILRNGDGFIFGSSVSEPHPAALEYAVKMRRLPEARMLDRLLAAGLVDRAALRAIAARIADFHARSASERGLEYGSATALRRAISSDLEESKSFIGYTLTEDDFIAIMNFCLAFITAHREIIDERARNGRVREGHGDLRAEHVCLVNDRIDVIDCVEFNERLRYGDVASEIAFLAMDLDRLGALALSDELVAAYAERTGDHDMSSFMPFYKCYRACVRGKVESLRSRDTETPARERAEAADLARRYFALARRYAKLASPAVIAVCGLSGTGKSTIASVVRARTGFNIVQSDRVRKRLAGLAPSQRIRSAYGIGIYSDGFSRLTYYTMLGEATESLRHNRGVILDATFKAAAERNRVRGLAMRFHMPILFVECVVSSEEAVRRLERRMTLSNEASDATPEVYAMQQAEFEPISEVPAASHVTINTDRGQEQVVHDIEAALERVAPSRLQSRGQGSE